ncbi:MAG: hypothetical protein ACRC2M_07800 [Planktothrix sp.]
MNNSVVLYNKVFTGEIPPVVINNNSVSVNTPTMPPGEVLQGLEIQLIKWRDIALKHLPSNAKLSTVETELKLEYLHFDYSIPSRVVVPSDDIPVMGRRDTLLQKQVKTLEFKSLYNRTGNHAFEFRLLKMYDSTYTLDSLTPFTNQINYNIGLDFPVGDLLYNNRLPSYMDLMPYLIKNGTLIFADIKQELRIQIIPKPELNDILIFGGGYSGSVTYELLPINTSVSKSEFIPLVGIVPTQILETNTDRYGFYLSNNGENNVYYSFGNFGGNSKLILKPNDTLVYEDKKLSINNLAINPGDNRYNMGLPLWVRSSTPLGINQVSIEEISYV